MIHQVVWGFTLISLECVSHGIGFGSKETNIQSGRSIFYGLLYQQLYKPLREKYKQYFLYLGITLASLKLKW